MLSGIQVHTDTHKHNVHNYVSTLLHRKDLSRQNSPQRADFNYVAPWTLLAFNNSFHSSTAHKILFSKINIPHRPIKDVILNDLITSTHVDICRYDCITLANTKYVCFSLSLSSVALQLEVQLLVSFVPDAPTGRRGEQLTCQLTVSLNNFDICRKGVYRVYRCSISVTDNVGFGQCDVQYGLMEAASVS